MTRKCRQLSDDLEVERRSLVGEKERSLGLSSSLKVLEESSSKLESVNRELSTELARLKEEVLERVRREEVLSVQKVALEAEISRLAESRQKLVDLERESATSVMSSRFGAFVDKVRAYLSDRDRVRPQILAETQVSGLLAVLRGI